jgi:hypothetical protein
MFISIYTFTQDKSLKGDGQIFWEEHFDWADPDDPRGWSLPGGWTIEDNSSDDNGYVWVWTRDSMQGPFSRRDGGYILNSTTGDNGFLSIDLDYLNEGKNYMEMLFCNSTITLPNIDCSNHSSVIISFEQMFKYFNSGNKTVMEVSNDNGAHWAEFDLTMGTGSAVNAMNLPNDEVAVYTANLSDIAGGQPNVTIKITWQGSMLYFWMLDDIIIYEGWDYDLKMNHWKAEMIDDRFEDSPGFFYMIPKSQIMPIGGFEGSVINYGEYEMTDVKFNITVNKNHIEQFNASSESVPYIFFGDPADTLQIGETYTPVDYGHYDINFSMTGNEGEQAPDNNEKSYVFHVTDSVFARTPDVSEANDSPWRSHYTYTHEGDIMGVEFNPMEDCTASSISVYISRSNLDVDFKFVLLEIVDDEGEQPEIVELLSSEVIWVDSTILADGWVTLPLDPDGIGEFMKAGGRYIAGVQFWTYIDEENLVNRRDAFWIGSTQSYPGSYDKQWWYSTYNTNWTQGSNYNKMIRLNIDEHGNIIDGVPASNNIFSLDQNYPNPFSSETMIGYKLVSEENVIIEILDASGKVVKHIDEGIRPAGQHSVILQKSNFDPGLYFYTLKAGNNSNTRRMIIK